MKITPNRAWIGIFSIWGLFLSGVLSSFIGSPGVIQALRLQSMLSHQQTQIDSIEKEISDLQTEADLLEKSQTAQQREIRKVLGYAAKDELIFDFSGGERL